MNRLPIGVCGTLSFVVLMSVAVLSLRAGACATNGKHASLAKDWKKYWTAHSKVTPANARATAQAGQLPSAQSNPWGGPDPENWKAEAILANAASEALNAGWALPGVYDVFVAVPALMQFSNVRPYADGQTNSSLKLGTGWNFRQPPLVATLVLLKDGGARLKLRFHRSLKLEHNKISLTYNVLKPGATLDPQDKVATETQKKTKTWDQPTLTTEGDFEVELITARAENPIWGDLFQNRVAFVQPVGWADWFPIDFRNVVKKASKLLEQVSPAQRSLAKGTLLDPENVSAQNSHDASFPFLKMKDENFGKEINADRYFPVPGSGIHNEFSNDENPNRITSVGHGNTLVMKNAPAPFKLAYICFDARNTKDEATFGVPSGGGWHEIGDPAETVFNTLERGPAVFGYANGQPEAQTPSGTFAYGLTDVIVIRKLAPGSALITAAGPLTKAEDDSGWENRGTHKTSSGRNYHWFIFDQPHEVCAVEWVHPQVPSPTNAWGLNLP